MERFKDYLIMVAANLTSTVLTVGGVLLIGNCFMGNQTKGVIKSGLSILKK